MEKMLRNEKRAGRTAVVLRVLALVFGFGMIFLTLFMMGRSNLNLGVVLPLFMGVPLAVYGVFQPRVSQWMRRGAGRVVKWVFIAGYAFLIAVFAIFGGMAGAASVTPPPEGAQAVIVLGAGLRQGDTPSLTLANRLDKAMEYAEDNREALIVVSGGKGPQESVTEASAMKRYLIEHGVDASRIVTEDRATSTYENFVYSKELLDERLGEDYTVAYVTNDFHVLRAGITARAAGLAQAHGLAAPTPIYTAPAAYLREALALLAVHAFGPEFD